MEGINGPKKIVASPGITRGEGGHFCEHYEVFQFGPNFGGDKACIEGKANKIDSRSSKVKSQRALTF